MSIKDISRNVLGQIAYCRDSTSIYEFEYNISDRISLVKRSNLLGGDTKRLTVSYDNSGFISSIDSDIQDGSSIEKTNKIRFKELLSILTAVQYWGNGIESIPVNSALSKKKRYPGQVWSNPSEQVITDYQVAGAGSTGAMDATLVRGTDTQTLKVNVNRGVATNTDFDVLHAVDTQFVLDGRIGMWVYIADVSLLTSLSLKVSLGDTTFTNGVNQTYNLLDGDKNYNGWHFVGYTKEEFGGSWGTPDFATQKVAKIRLSINQNSATATTVNIGRVIVGWKQTARLLITADDGYANWFKYAVPYLTSKGLKSTASIIADQVNLSSTWVSLSQLKQAYSDGHDICTHGGFSLDSFADQAAMQVDIAHNRDFLLTNGFTRAARFYVLPNGTFQLSPGDQTIVNALKAEGFVAARGTLNPAYIKTPDGIGFKKWFMPRIGTMEEDAVATITGRVDSLILSGSTSFLMYHDIALDGGSALIRNFYKFRQEIDYIATKVEAGELEVIGVSDLIIEEGL